MGGRGASSGVSNSGKEYGTEYRSVITKGNIKFVVKNEGSATAPMETMTKGRVYATIGSDGEVRTVSYYSNDGKRIKQIDVAGRPHIIDGEKVLPHTHIGYKHREGGTDYLTRKEQRMVARIKAEWAKYKKKR